LLEGTAIELVDPESAGASAAVVKGAWPGVRQSRGNDAAAGPTGAAWIDSNGWLARLTAVRRPGTAVWIDAPPEGPRVFPDSYLIAIADSAAFGARWILTLDDELAGRIAAREPGALATWNRIAAASRFFADHMGWTGWQPQALVGVVSDFAGANEFLSQELLNLLDRTGMHFRILLKDHLPASPFTGLRAVLYADQQPPSGALRRQILDYVNTGGMLIAAPKWGAGPGRTASQPGHPRFSEKLLGKGRIALCAVEPDDPYVLANDSVVLVSHRYDLVRCWNSGAFSSHYTMAPDRSKAVVHLVFYAGRGPDSASVRITGKWRAAAISTIGDPSPKPVRIETQRDAVEVYLPQVSQYVALQLEG
jgi:hypothetical protein